MEPPAPGRLVGPLQPWVRPLAEADPHAVVVVLVLLGSMDQTHPRGPAVATGPLTCTTLAVSATYTP